eukprot:UN26718
MYAYYAGSYFIKSKTYRSLGKYVFQIQMTQFSELYYSFVWSRLLVVGVIHSHMCSF